MTTGQLALRGTIGPLFMGHGAQKLFGTFGGHGLEGTGGFFESLGLHPGKRHAAAAGAAEMAGGAMLTLGAMTPLATASLTGTMVTAIRKVHLRNGPWTTEGGWEYNAVLVAALTALAESGPGRPSVDSRRFPRLKGTAIALASLAAGIAGSFLATEVFNEPDGEAPQEGQADMPADPATAGSSSGADAGAERAGDGRFAQQPVQDASTTAS